jgi:hypothetical protein
MAQPRKGSLTWTVVAERVTGIEPALSAWENVEGRHARPVRARAAIPLLPLANPFAPLAIARGSHAGRRRGACGPWISRVRRPVNPPRRRSSRLLAPSGVVRDVVRVSRGPCRAGLVVRPRATL